MKLLTIIGCVLPVSLATAQEFERIAPKPVPPAKSGSKSVPGMASAKPRDPAVRVKELKGVVFHADPQKVKREGIKEASGLDVSAVPALDTAAFRARMSKFLGQSVSFASIEDLVNEVVAYFKGTDRPFVVVSTPEQDFTSGVLQLVVIEGKVGEVKVQGAKWFPENAYRQAVRVQPGDSIYKQRLDADMEWLNRNPFREASVVMEPGKGFGTADVLVQARDRFPWRFYTGYEDSGTASTDNNRWLAGVNWGNAFGAGHQLNYQFMTSSDFEQLRAHSATYSAALPWRHTLSVFGAYSDINATVPAPFLSSGSSWQVGLRYEVPLPKLAAYEHGVTLGFDFKQSDNNLLFGGATVTATKYDVVQWSGSYNGSLRDPFGSTRFDATVFYSPGGWSARNKDSQFQAIRALSDSTYAYANFGVERATRLPGDFSWMLSGRVQFADGNLAGSEQMGLGGYSTVRGYEEREANGDEGFLIKNELRLPPFSPGQLTGIGSLRDELQLLAFFDYGATQNKNLLAGEDPHLNLSSVGGGVRYSVGRNVSARFDYGWQLQDRSLNPRNNSRMHLAVTVSY